MENSVSILKRFIALLIDIICIIAMLFVNGAIVFVMKVYFPYDIISYILIGLLVFLFNQAYLQGYHGFTIGKAFMKLRVINTEGRYIGVYNSFRREILKLSWVIILGWGFFSALSDKNKQTYHDKIVDSYVVNEEKDTIFCFNLLKKPRNKPYIRYFREFDVENNAFLEEISDIIKENKYYKVYIDNDGYIIKYGYFSNSILINFTKFRYEDNKTSTFDYDANGKFIRGIKYIFDKKGNVIDRIPINKDEYKQSIA